MTDKPVQTRDPLVESADFQRALIDWFVADGRDYPWRRTADPYAILVSELMLQQTQIATVLERRYFERWLERFPDVAALADAPETDVLKQWEGLGYYNRARNLQKAAQVVVGEHGGEFPDSLEKIHALPGVGRYTAGAVMSFAFDRPAPIVDGNVARVFARLFDWRDAIEITVSQKQLWSWAEALLPEKSVREYNSALMELGQRVCTKSAPDCHECPVASFCVTRSPESLPRKKAARETVHVIEHALFAVSENRILLEQESGSRRKGLWRLPLLSESLAVGLPVLLKTRYAITHHRVDLIVHQAETQQGKVVDPTLLNDWPTRQWIDLETEYEAIAMPSPFRKAVDRVLAMKREAEQFRLS
ncbi:MAG: A/G-specific adenine glycosylase [Verrucomicrobiae bacterium]|nr:A/G-specific adenine glycosylase [Verrucomicrobiae bacterium]